MFELHSSESCYGVETPGFSLGDIQKVQGSVSNW